jgi:hypothetical protein
MTQRIALLRGINVGRAKRIAMTDPQGLLELGPPVSMQNWSSILEWNSRFRSWRPSL